MSVNIYDKNQDELYSVAGGGSAHKILDSSGTSMPDQTKLQFVNMTVTNDSVNKKTIVTAPSITSGTTDLTPGVSDLATGAIYMYLEE